MSNNKQVLDTHYTTITNNGNKHLTSLEIDLTIVIPALHEGPNLAILLPQVQDLFLDRDISCEILVVSRNTDAETLEVGERFGVTIIEQEGPGYGSALTTGFRKAKGKYILTMDADLSHLPTFILDLWAKRDQAEVIIASRYIKGGTADMPKSRFWLSRILNQFFSRGLSMPVRDLSSGFRLYKASLIKDQEFKAHNFDILPEILVKVYAEGWQVKEIPFHYSPRKHGSSNARVFIFGLAYLRTFYYLWKLRNSVLSADYDDRAYNSLIWLQRYWQRSRYKHITELIKGEGKVLDVGCGSSRIIGALPDGSVALDIATRKVRYARKFKKLLVEGSGFNLPFADKSFPCVLSSQVIEHVPFASPILSELDRVLTPGGLLVLGTPDYARWEWVYIEKAYGKVAPGAYADEHITHYTRQQLIDIFEKKGYKLEATRYILRGELILALRKL